MKISNPAAWVMALGLLGQAGLASATDSDAESRPATRSEVLADLEVWRTSGMEALATIEEPPGASDAHRTAQAHYQNLRNGPEFSRIVARIAREIGEVVDLAGVRR